jgi:hypothetical protein
MLYSGGGGGKNQGIVCGKVNVKQTVTLEHAMKVQWRRTGIAILFL